MKSRTVLFLFIVFVAGVCQALAESGDGGQPGAFMRRGLGGRALGMGSAYSSLANDASAVYWNPAGLCAMERMELQGMYSVLTFDRQEMFVGVGGGAVARMIAVGAAWYKFGVKDIDGRDRLGNATQRFEDSENCFMLSASALLVQDVALGITGKYIHHSLADRSASGAAMDLGLRITLVPMFTVGFVLQDLLGQLSWNTESGLKEKLPTTARGGVAFQPDFLPVSLALEFAKTGKANPLLRAGTEYRILDILALRAGFDGSYVALGGMIIVPGERVKSQVDYAITKDALESTFVHHISLRLNF
jgi:hypothetical protein